ncbi:MAG TPA: HEAT repeat domain-containing protein [Verrucomicrobiae bacterium]|jgi:HEAT repeat protein|nr:HEAT repeat domain-containing protein [Verrucomicrobiae bacterium]
MKRNSILALSLSLLMLPSFRALAADPSEETRLIAVLQSDASSYDKAAGCAELKRIGTKESVPALSALLADEQLSQLARYALEPMPGPEAGEALLVALPKTSGSNQIGIINSLAARHQPDAVPALGKLLFGNDLDVTVAAAEALGRIGGTKSLSKLEAVSPLSSGRVHAAEIDGELWIANQLLAQGEMRPARKTFQRLYDSEKNDGVRGAAFRGLILSAGKRGITLMSDAIAGSDVASQGAALQIASKLKGAAVTIALADLLPKVAAPVQIALLHCLDQRADPSAMRAVASVADSSDSNVCLAAITALGELGDGSVGLLLAQKAAATTGAEQAAARESLLELHRGSITPALVTDIDGAAPDARLELIRALGNRADGSAVSKLSELARGGDDSTRAAAFQALALLAGPRQIPDMVQSVIDAKSDDARSEAADALGTACQRIESEAGHVDASAVADSVRTAPLQARLSLLPVCAGLSEGPARDALRAALQDTNPQVRKAAVSAVCDTRDAEMLPTLVQLAGDSEQKFRLLAIRGCVRLTTQDETVKIPVATKLQTFKTILDRPLDAAEKRLVLSALGAIPDDQALALATPILDDPDVQPEAARAVIDIATAIYVAHPDAAEAAFKKVLATSNDPDTKKAARVGLRKIEELSEYIATWQVAGPYLQADKNYEALFNITFPPEQAGGDSVNWQPLAAGTDPAEPWKLDLLQALGGEQRVAYARTWVYSPNEQPARLELGSDDGNKVWLNGQLVHSNNASRALQRDSDNVDVTLRAGWNPLLLKVTQNNAGWSFCVRVVSPDGKRLPDVRASLVR